PGPVRITANANGFRSYARDLNYDVGRPGSVNFQLNVASVAETIVVNGSAVELNRESQRIEKELKKQKDQMQGAASANVYNLQKRVSGVLPVRVDVPRAGNSYRFVRPLVLDEETKVTFTYKSK
ncbi:MAG TPA: hypothetical protein VEI54_09785, partial [Candidatus Limnocylindrales bacterium]|nr:hypothetical protein [Candidatus Limnocylindrales bacterium]